MKNRKKQFLKIGGIVAVFAVVGIVAGVMQYKKDHRFDLTVAEHTISKEEYVNCIRECSGADQYHRLLPAAAETGCKWQRNRQTGCWGRTSSSRYLAMEM